MDSKDTMINSGVNSGSDTGLIERMFKAGAHFGYSRSRRHPSTSPFIFGTKNKVEVFDLEKTSDLLLRAKEFARKFGEEGKKILFVSGKYEAQDIIIEAASSIEMPYVAGRWIGGTLTNFSEMKKRIERLEDLTDKRESGELEKKYTKKERLLIDREIASLEAMFLGLLLMKKLPDALFVIDTKKESAAVAEAKKIGIPTISLSNSDCNVADIEYPIVANDASLSSITFFIREIAESYKYGVEHKPAQVENNSEEKKDSNENTTGE